MESSLLGFSLAFSSCPSVRVDLVTAAAASLGGSSHVGGIGNGSPASIVPSFSSASEGLWNL